MQHNILRTRRSDTPARQPNWDSSKNLRLNAETQRTFASNWTTKPLTKKRMRRNNSLRTWALQHNTWQRTIGTMKTNERKVRERQHKRNRKTNMKTKTRVSRMENISSCNLLWGSLLFLVLHSRISFDKQNRRKQKWACGFFRIIFGRDCPGSSAGQILFEKIPMEFKMDLLVIGFQEARNSSKRVRRNGEGKSVLLCNNRFLTRHCALRTVNYGESYFLKPLQQSFLC